MTGSPGNVSITSAPPPQGLNDAGLGAIALDRGPAGALSTGQRGQRATLTIIPGPEGDGDLQSRPFRKSLLARCALAVVIAFALPAGIAAIALLHASPGPDSFRPWHVLLDLFRHAWTGPIATLVRILVVPFFALAPLVAIVAIAALVELARPGQTSRAHTRTRTTPWT